MSLPSVSRGPGDWLKVVAKSPLAGYNWTISCFLFSGVFSLCGIILDPNTKRPVVATSRGDAIA